MTTPIVHDAITLTENLAGFIIADFLQIAKFGIRFFHANVSTFTVILVNLFEL